MLSVFQKKLLKIRQILCVTHPQVMAVKKQKKVSTPKLPPFKRSNDCSLTREPKVKGLRNYLKRIRNSFEEFEAAGNPDPASKILNPKYSKYPIIPLCTLTHLPANYTDPKSRLFVYDKTISYQLACIGVDGLKNFVQLRGWGNELFIMK